jgi:UDP-2,3-diacylglucosamine hydrolase
MLSAYFVSDIHIASPDEPRAALFLDWLRSLSGGENATHLFLLGDIFDLWVADHGYFIERYAEIVAEIRRLRGEGVDIQYFEGNHDLHLRYFWADRLGVTVRPGPVQLQLGGKAVRLEHGDQMNPDDRGYLFLRWFLRTPPVRFLIRHMPGSLVARIGDRASASSRAYTSSGGKAISAEEVTAKALQHARKVHAVASFDLIISGHIHVRHDQAVDSESGHFRSVNLGSWMDGPCYFKIDGKDENFHELDAAEKAARSDTMTGSARR